MYAYSRKDLQQKRGVLNCKNWSGGINGANLHFYHNSANGLNLTESNLKQHPHRRIQALEHAHPAARGLQQRIQIMLAGQRDRPAFAGIVLLDDGNLQGASPA